MRLTSQMRDEVSLIRRRMAEITEKANAKFSTKRLEVCESHEQELNVYKVHLEKLFSNTDLKNQKINILQILLSIEHILSNGESSDFGRYAQMGMQIEPTESQFLYRTEKLKVSSYHVSSFSVKAFILFSILHNTRISLFLRKHWILFK